MPDISTLKGIEQKRADYAYKCVLEANQVQTTARQIDTYFYLAKKYKSYASKIPMYIKVNGLGSTFAFILSKTVKDKKGNDNQPIPAGSVQNHPKNAYDLIYKQTSDWLRVKFPFEGDLTEFIITQNSNEYRTLTNEVITLFGWLKRFSEGLIEGEEDSND